MTATAVKADNPLKIQDALTLQAELSRAIIPVLRSAQPDAIKRYRFASADMKAAIEGMLNGMTPQYTPSGDIGSRRYALKIVNRTDRPLRYCLRLWVTTRYIRDPEERKGFALTVHIGEDVEEPAIEFKDPFIYGARARKDFAVPFSTLIRAFYRWNGSVSDLLCDMVSSYVGAFGTFKIVPRRAERGAAVEGYDLQLRCDGASFSAPLNETAVVHVFAPRPLVPAAQG